ncbi:hypothetical protein ABZV58_29140 [Nocardia sp. NPDC004654]|uniref:hypothetical protein n=1 Tax=Nocardia sp. NPDC004654 TaxID=3154776 RepID=UPI0033B8CBFA
MSDDTIVALSREETLTLLLDGLPDYLASVHRIIEFAYGMAARLGGESFTALEHLLDQHERTDRLVRVSHRALKPLRGTDIGGADGR